MTNNVFGPTGVAITGTGNTLTNVQATGQANNSIPPTDLLAALANMREAVKASPDLTAEQREDQELAIDDLETEAKNAHFGLTLPTL